MGGSRRSGPDPNRVYTVKTAGAPTKGPDTAAGDDRRVLRVPVPVLCQGRSDSQADRRHVPGQQYESSGSTCRSPFIKTRLAPRSRRKPRGNRASSGSSTTGCSPDQNRARARRLEAAREGASARPEPLRGRSAQRRRKEENRRRRGGSERARIKGTPGIFINGRFIAEPSHSRRSRKSSTRSSAKRNLPIPSRPSN